MARKTHKRRTRKRKHRKNRNKYLGRGCTTKRCVRDVGKPGLDKPSEYRKIMKRILEDYRHGRITKKKARGRLLLLYRLTYAKHNSKTRGWSPKTRQQIRKQIKQALRQL